MSNRKPSLTEINRMNNKQLKDTLKRLLSDLKDEHESDDDPVPIDDAANVSQLLNSILNEVKELRKEKNNLTEVQKLKQENLDLTQAVFQHQRFLESIDAEKRSNNLIITGIPEDANITLPGSGAGAPAIVANQDDTKVSLVLQQIGNKDDVSVLKVTRLGKKPFGPDAPPRPLKVVTATPGERKAVLDNAKKLKSAGPEFKRIYVNKDIHPMVRKELNRIRKVEKEEKGKPENQGHSVRYDHESRCVFVDDILIDRFKPMFF